MNPSLRFFACALGTWLLVACDPVATVEKTDVKPPVPVVDPLPVQVSFNEHIQPVLSEYCYHCHGPDSGTREPKKAPLRLDRVEDAFALRDDDRPVILKGN
ncbi:hypothetical protein HQ447_06800, partial [bacterium]|nr:hypothetical protein [bacterium]